MEHEFNDNAKKIMNAIVESVMNKKTSEVEIKYYAFYNIIRKIVHLLPFFPLDDNCYSFYDQLINTYFTDKEIKSEIKLDIIGKQYEMPESSNLSDTIEFYKLDNILTSKNHIVIIFNCNKKD